MRFKGPVQQRNAVDSTIRILSRDLSPLIRRGQVGRQSPAINVNETRVATLESDFRGWSFHGGAPASSFLCLWCLHRVAVCLVEIKRKGRRSIKATKGFNSPICSDMRVARFKVRLYRPCNFVHFFLLFSMFDALVPLLKTVWSVLREIIVSGH